MKKFLKKLLELKSKRRIELKTGVQSPSSCKNGDVMARSVFDEKWTLNDCMNELEHFRMNAFLNIRKHEGVREV